MPHVNIHAMARQCSRCSARAIWAPSLTNSGNPQIIRFARRARALLPVSVGSAAGIQRNREIGPVQAVSETAIARQQVRARKRYSGRVATIDARAPKRSNHFAAPARLSRHASDAKRKSR